MKTADDQQRESDSGSLIRRAAAGDKAALDALISEFYPRLRDIAGRLMSREDPGHTLQPTALVNEAYLRMLGDRSLKPNQHGLFIWLAVRAMRRLLKDHWRHKNTLENGRCWKRVSFDSLKDVERFSREQFVELCDAIEHLEKLSPTQAMIAESHLLGGRTLVQVSEDLDKPLRTVEKHWQAARTKLKLLLDHP